MKKMYSLILVTTLLLSGFVSAGLLDNESQNEKIFEIISFSEPFKINYNQGYIDLNLEGSNSFLDDPGKPMIPIYRKVLEFSKEVKINEIVCKYSNIKYENIDRKIIPAPESIPLNLQEPEDNIPKRIENEGIYQSDKLYPSNWYSYNIKCGLNNNGEQTTFLIIDFYPIRYNPIKNKILYIDEAEIQISYDDPGFNEIKSVDGSYDLLIIAPQVFSGSLQKFIDHKNTMGINTIVKTVEEILVEYSGRDEPEQIKYFIKYAKENLDITYVLLFGGLKSYLFANDKDDQNHGSTNGWHVPVRYTNIRHSNEVGVISDLYYSDLYKYDESSQEWVFEDWDSNGDGIFAQGGAGQRDILDLVPDLYVGRLACRTSNDLDIVVDKIIQYETTSPDDKPWFNRMVGIGGRTFSLFDGQDQFQAREDNSSFISEFEWQEVVPRNELLARVDVKISQTFSGSPNIMLSIEKPLGNILTSIELPASEIPTDNNHWISFDFPDIYTIPYETYYITLAAPLGSEYQWSFGEPTDYVQDRYPLGNSSLGYGYDWCFRTYDLAEDEEQPDGEYSVDAAFSYMADKTDEEVRVYWSNEGTNEPTPETQDIIDAFTNGAGYIIMEGHGNPVSWATHPVPDDAPFRGGISITDYEELQNGDKLPIVIIGGCHNSLINVSLIKTLFVSIFRVYLQGLDDNWYWNSGYFTPYCMAWRLLTLPEGGAIASTGCTGLGLGGSPPHLINSGGLDCNFFYQIGREGFTSLGGAHSSAISKYILENTISNDEQFCIVEFHLNGDPSLRLGGYP